MTEKLSSHGLGGGAAAHRARTGRYATCCDCGGRLYRRPDVSAKKRCGTAMSSSDYVAVVAHGRRASCPDVGHHGYQTRSKSGQFGPVDGPAKRFLEAVRNLRAKKAP